MAVDTSAMHLYGREQIRTGPQGSLAPGAVGDARLTPGGDPLPVYDVLGEPMDRIRADGWGFAPQFYAPTDGGPVLMDFGSYVVEQYPLSALKDASQAREAKVTAERALSAADGAVRAAQAAAASAATASMTPEQLTSTVKAALMADPNFSAGGATAPLDISTSQALAAYAAAKAGV